MVRPKQIQIHMELGVRLDIDPAREVRKRVDFLKVYLKKTGLKGFILGISGGVDSTNAGKLAQMAVDELNSEIVTDEFDPNQIKYKFVAIRLPYGVQVDEADAQAALDFIKPTEVTEHNIKYQVDAAIEEHKRQGRTISDFVKGNLKARSRMLAQYDIAAEEGLLVVGTDHAAEAVTGFFTKFGDGAADILPLSGLTKRQGREIAKYLGAPEHLYAKVATADLLDGKPQQTDEDELGITYEQLDDYLEEKEVPVEVAEKIEKRYKITQHKRQLPVTPSDSWWAFN